MPEKSSDTPPEQSIAPRFEGALMPRPEMLTEKSYRRRRWEFTLEQWREHPKLELEAGLVGALITGVVGVWIASTQGVGFVGAALLISLLAVLGFTATLIAILLIYLMRSPKSLDKKLRGELSATRLLLDEEKAKNEKPEITDEIRAIHVDAMLDCFLSIEVRIKSGRAQTTISDFALTLTFNGESHPARSVPVKEYFLERTVDHPVAFHTISETAYEPLKDLAKDNDVPFTKGTHRDGWLRFQLPHTINAGFVGAVEGRQFLKEGVELALTVYDGRGDPHIIPYVSRGKLYPVEIRRLEPPPVWRKLTDGIID